MAGVSPERFNSFLAGLGVPADASDRHVADLQLACGCVDRDPAALAELDRELSSVVSAVTARSDAETRAELLQSLRIKLVVGGDSGPAIATYTGKGSLRSWLKVAALRHHLNDERTRARRREDELGEIVDHVAAETLALVPRARENTEALRLAIADAVEALEPFERRLLRQHHLEGLTFAELADIYEIHRITIARRVSRARDKILCEARVKLVQLAKLGSGDVDGVINDLLSALEVSFARLLESR